jgi:hypothetical protein
MLLAMTGAAKPGDVVGVQVAPVVDLRIGRAAAFAGRFLLAAGELVVCTTSHATTIRIVPDSTIAKRLSIVGVQPLTILLAIALLIYALGLTAVITTTLPMDVRGAGAMLDHLRPHA